MTDQQQREWPAFVYQDGGDIDRNSFAYWSDGEEPSGGYADSVIAPYIHRDAARIWANAIVGAQAMAMCQAWQHFRAFLDGTPEQWAEREQAAYQRGWPEALQANGLPTRGVRDYGPYELKA